MSVTSPWSISTCMDVSVFYAARIRRQRAELPVSSSFSSLMERMSLTMLATGTDNIDDATSVTESSDDSSSTGTPNSSPDIGPLSMTGDRVVRRPVFRAPNPSSSYGIGPRSHGEPSRASNHFSDSEQHVDQMEVDSRTIRDSEDSCRSKATTHENGPHSRNTSQYGPTVNRHGPRHQEDENVFMSDDAHAGPSSASAVVPSEARAKRLTTVQSLSSMMVTWILTPKLTIQLTP